MKIKIKGTSRNPDLKGRILCWCDSPTVSTGFGTVARHILKGLYNSGYFDIDILAINFDGRFPDKVEFPYTIIPSSMANTKDPYGNALLTRSVQQKPYDILFVLNDTFAVSGVGEYLKEIQDKIMGNKGEPFKIIYYFPVDCHVLDRWTGMLKVSDRLIAYNEYGMQEAAKVGYPPHRYIYHGVDTNTFKPISAEERAKIRREIFHINDDNTFLWLNINRNSLRKDISRTIFAFAEYRKKFPMSKLYCHTKVIDGRHAGGVEIDLQVPCKELGLKIGEDIMFPQDYSPANGVTDKVLNSIYCAGDGYITTTLGEGWGLTATEAMAAGIPTVVPNSTSFPEIIGADKVRGYMYEATDCVLFDSSGFRPFAPMQNIVNKMIECHKERFSTKQKQIIRRAREWTEKEIDWKYIVRQWVNVFSETLKIKKFKEKESAGPEVI